MRLPEPEDGAPAQGSTAPQHLRVQPGRGRLQIHPAVEIWAQGGGKGAGCGGACQGGHGSRLRRQVRPLIACYGPPTAQGMGG